MLRKNFLLRGIIAIICGLFFALFKQGYVFKYAPNLRVDYLGWFAVVLGVVYIIIGLVKK